MLEQKRWRPYSNRDWLDWTTTVLCRLLGSSLWKDLLVILHCLQLPLGFILCTALCPKGADSYILRHLDSLVQPTGSTSKTFKSRREREHAESLLCHVSLLHLHISNRGCFYSCSSCQASPSSMLQLSMGSGLLPLWHFRSRGGTCFPHHLLLALGSSSSLWFPLTLPTPPYIVPSWHYFQNSN